MDCGDDIRVIFNLIIGVSAGRFVQPVCIIEQALHLGLRTAIAKLQVVEHREILLSEAIVGVLDAFNVRAHFVGVIRHIDNRSFCHLSGLYRVTTERICKRRCKACGGLHVLIRGEPRLSVCGLCVLQDLICTGGLYTAV